ncbi:FGGY-family carbohydrate kinase [Microbacterium ulmi]|uniref:Sugar kinase n=1 Tax=Microbacterium ulmi TaxID=179095 RepID=A0A7Y2PZ31_9MICO|nr:FGGY family carbohydrate kinase [Microbacterium ulmi]NII69372.1 xylulokinase [Microbacterium ulmi]NNH04016.1 sugar kinase [Microbacterium ulmi]
MSRECVFGFDVGTSSSKGVLADCATGEIVATVIVPHDIVRPRPGWAEMDGPVWWSEFVEVAHALLARADRSAGDVVVKGVGVSGMGPSVLLADDEDRPVRPAILYGVDTRATRQIDEMRAVLGDPRIVEVGGSLLTSQAGGPKIRWIADEEPDNYVRARRLFMPASYLVRMLTGEYVLDHQSASQMSPLYDIEREEWFVPWWERFSPGLERPALAWPGDVAGHVTADASAATGLPVGVPVIVGTIDAWAEAVSVGAHTRGDLMLMYGTTMFLIATGAETLRAPSMWTTAGAFPGTRNLAGGLAASGSLTAWLRQISDADYPVLLAEAEASGPGAQGLVMLPYFAGERTPILDPDARGVIAGLTLGHTRGDLYRAALEATALGVRHNLEAMRGAGADIRRIVAVGGGTQGALWLQVVSDVTGLAQEVPRTTIGASYGSAFLAAAAVAAPGESPDITAWNPIVSVVRPRPELAPLYDELFSRYRRLYDCTRELAHELAAAQTARAAAPTLDPSPQEIR